MAGPLDGGLADKDLLPWSGWLSLAAGGDYHLRAQTASTSTDNHSTTLPRTATSSEPHNSADNADPPRISARLRVLVLACVQNPGLCVRMPPAGCPPDMMLDCQVLVSICLLLSHFAYLKRIRLPLARVCTSIFFFWAYHSEFGSQLWLQHR